MSFNFCSSRRAGRPCHWNHDAASPPFCNAHHCRLRRGDGRFLQAEERSFRVPPPVAELSETFSANTPVRPGPDAAGTYSTSQPVNLTSVLYEPYGRQFPNNAQALSDGQNLYEGFKCSGCHAHGGGGMGPPLLDNKWVWRGAAGVSVDRSGEAQRHALVSRPHPRQPGTGSWSHTSAVSAARPTPTPPADAEDHMTASRRPIRCRRKRR